MGAAGSTSWRGRGRVADANRAICGPNHAVSGTGSRAVGGGGDGGPCRAQYTGATAEATASSANGNSAKLVKVIQKLGLGQGRLRAGFEVFDDDGLLGQFIVAEDEA